MPTVSTPGILRQMNDGPMYRPLSLKGHSFKAFTSNYCHILCQYLVLRDVFIRVFLIYLPRHPPFGRAVFLPPAIVAVGGEVYANPQPIARQENEDSFHAVLTQYDSFA